MWAQLLNAIIFAVVTCTSVFVGIYLTDIIKQKLPAHTRLALEQFAKMAVRQVEKNNSKLSGSAKKQLAILTVATLLKNFHLPQLDRETIGIAIEAEVFLLPKSIVVADSLPKLPETTKANE